MLLMWPFAQSIVHRSDNGRRRRFLIFATHFHLDLLTMGHTKSQNRDQAFGIHLLLTIPNTNNRLILLGEIDKNACGAGMEPGGIMNNKIKLLHDALPCDMAGRRDSAQIHPTSFRVDEGIW